jgi:hypothetical protein
VLVIEARLKSRLADADAAYELAIDLQSGDQLTTQEFPSRGGARCDPAQIHRVRAGGDLEGRYNAGSSRPPSRVACRTRTVR